MAKLRPDSGARPNQSKAGQGGGQDSGMFQAENVIGIKV